MNPDDFPLPPATFDCLIFSLKTQAEMRLGLLKLGPEQDQAPDLPTARHAIDLLAMLGEKTKGNLSIEEQRMLENSLTELRFRFVQVSENLAKNASPEAATETGDTPAS